MIGLLFYNWIKRPVRNWRFRHQYFAEWVAEGKDPAMFPHLAPLTRADLDWAKQIIKTAPWRFSGLMSSRFNL